MYHDFGILQTITFLGWQKRIAEKAKGPKIPKILQEREMLAAVELRMSV